MSDLVRTSHLLALAAAAALLKYVEFIQNVTFAANRYDMLTTHLKLMECSMKVEFKSDKHSMSIDREAVRSLVRYRHE